jgi:hypothetical protein
MSTTVISPTLHHVNLEKHRPLSGGPRDELPDTGVKPPLE